MKLIFLLAVIGHVLCGVTDCLLGYSKKGRLKLKDVSDPQKMRDMFQDMPLSFPHLSMLLGTLAILLFGFGYFALSDWMKAYSEVASKLMFVAAVVYLIPIVTHHVFCGAVEWFYIRMGRTDEAREAVLEFFKKTMATMIAGYAGLLVFLITLFAMIVTGKTDLPAWGCVFNTLVFMILLTPTKLPAKGNIAGALMFLGLLFLI